MINKISLICIITLFAYSTFGDEKPMAYAVNGNLITDPYAGYVDDGWRRVDRGIKTPSQEFAKPYIEGKLNVLLIAPFQEARAVVELEQRFDFNVDIFMSASYKKLWAKNDNWTRRAYLKPFKKHEAKQLNLSKYDVIILGGLAWEDLFFDMKYKILKAVSSGKGLVMIPYMTRKTSDLKTSLVLKEVFSKPCKDNGYIVEGIPFDSMRGFGVPHRRNAKIKNPGETVKTFVFKKGKAVVLNYKPMTKGFLAPVRVHSDFMFDFYQALLGRSVIWASGKTPPVQIRKTSLDGVKTVMQNKSNKISLDLNNAKSKQNYSLEILVRINDKQYSKTVAKSLTKINVSKGNCRIDALLPYLPAGKAVVDIYIKKNKAVVDWRSRIINVKRSNIKIAGITEPYKINGINDIVPVTLKMSGKPQAGVILKVSCRDVYGRIVKNESLKITNKPEIKLNVPLKRVMGNQVWLTLKLMKGDTVLQYLTKRIYRADTSRPDFITLAWCGGFYSDDNSPWSRGVYKTLKKTGINVVQPPLVFWRYNPNVIDRGIIATDVGLKVAPMISRIVAQKNPVAAIPRDNIGRGGFTDSKAYDKIVDNAAKIARGYAAMGAVLYNVGDENGFHFFKENDLCRREETFVGFRKNIKKRYKNLNALNHEWKTSFKTWKEVKPDTLKEAKKRSCFASWADFRDYMETVLCDSHTKITNALKAKGIKDPKTCIDGLSDFRHCLGHDITKLPKVVNEVSPYDKNLSLSLVRDINPNSNVIVNQGVYSSRTGHHDGFLWEALARGARASLFWNVYTGEQDWTHGVMPDLRPAVPLADEGKDCLALNRGPARLIKKSKMLNSPVAVLYSRPSIRVTDFIDGSLGKNYSSMRVLLPGASEYFGLNPKFIDSSTLNSSNKMRQFKVLVLPCTQAISNKDAEAVKHFVRSGGTVIADSRPGIFTEHCGKRAQAALDKVFGVKQKQKSDPVREIVKVRWFDPKASEKQKSDAMLQDAAISGGVVKKKKQGSIVADGGIKLAGAKAEMVLPRTKTPIIIRNKYGKGQAILLNLKNVPEILPLWEKLLKQAGINIPIKAFSESGKELHQFRYSIFKNGNVSFVMLFDGLNCPAIVSLPRKAYVYNVRDGKFMGYTDKVKLPTLKKPWMLALLPAKTTAVNITLPKTIEAGSDLKGSFKLDFAPDIKSSHVICVRVFNPKGAEMRYYQQLVNSDNGSGHFLIPLAKNETPGSYLIKVTDAATGVSSDKKIYVSAERKN